MHILALLKDLPGAPDVDHEPFVDALIDAEALVAEDHLVARGPAVPVLARWDLVGVNRGAIDP